MQGKTVGKLTFTYWIDSPRSGRYFLDQSKISSIYIIVLNVYIFVHYLWVDLD